MKEGKDSKVTLGDSPYPGPLPHPLERHGFGPPCPGLLLDGISGTQLPSQCGGVI